MTTILRLALRRLDRGDLVGARWYLEAALGVVEGRRTMGRRTKKFVSKAQQAWAWATGKAFARRKSREGADYRRMPRKKR